MKIGVITYHRAINYGAILQTYALQVALNKIGIESEVIDYRCKNIEEKYWKTFKKQSIKAMIKGIMLKKRNDEKRKKFYKFTKENIKISNLKYLTHSELTKSNNEYDYFITGSDQVWHYYLTNMDEAYFLNFVKDSNKKCSYAASFGMQTLPIQYEEQYKHLLKDYYRMSVREEQGRSIIKNLINKDVPVVLDPTFLLNRDDWKKVSIEPKEKDYILIYIMKGSDTLFKFAEELSRETGCKIKYITNGLKKPIEAEYITTAGIEEFVGLFANARYVITNSFHGTAFSLIMNKDFFLELQAPPAANDRLENIMDTYNLRSREIINGKNNNIHKSIDYRFVNEKLDFKRQQSIDFLQSIVANK